MLIVAQEPAMNIAGIEVYIVPSEVGTWVAATAGSPFFCIEADTEQAAEDVARRAVEFYHRQRAAREIDNGH